MITIEKGIPMPIPGNLKYPWKQMQIGDSFVAELASRNSFSTCAKQNGIKIKTQKQPDGTVRVWRIA